MRIEFSDKVKQDLFKPYTLMSPDKLVSIAKPNTKCNVCLQDEMGDQIQTQILQAVEEQSQPRETQEGGEQYLRRMN